MLPRIDSVGSVHAQVPTHQRYSSISDGSSHAASHRNSGVGAPFLGGGRLSLPSLDEPLNSWRDKYIANENCNSDGLRHTSMRIPDNSRFTTSMSICEDLPLMAVGSGSYDTNLYFVSAEFSSADTDGQQLPVFQARASFASKFPIYSLSFQSDLLITGTERGASILYKVDRRRLLGISSGSGNGDSDDGDAGLVQCLGAYRNKSSKGMDSAVPGHHIPTRRVHCVEFAPPFAGSRSSSGDSPNSLWPPSTTSSDSALFLSCLYGVVNVFDANNRQRALRSEKVSVQPVFHAAWNPHSPASMIATGGVDGSVCVLDLRKNGRSMVWRACPDSLQSVGSGDASSISSLAWSPFLPYWLSSATDGGQIQLWDLRFSPGPGGSPVAAISQKPHRGAITALCWSRKYLDQLAAGTSDHRWQVHSLRRVNADQHVTRGGVNGGGNLSASASPRSSHASQGNHHPRLETQIVADWRAGIDIGRIVALGTTALHPDVFYSLSSCGDLYAYRMTDSMYTHLVPHRFSQKKHPEEYALESKIYFRDLSTAARGLSSVISNYLDESSSGLDPSSRVLSLSREIRDLCDLFRVKPSVPFDEWTLMPNAKAQVSLGSNPALGDAAGRKRSSARLSLSGRPDLLAPLGLALEGQDGAQFDAMTTAALEELLDDLQVFGYGLPPGYRVERVIEQDKSVWKALTQLDMLKLRLRLEDLVKEANSGGRQAESSASLAKETQDDRDPNAWQKIVERQPQLLRYIRVNPDLYDANLLKNIVKTVLPHDCLQGLRMGLALCKAYLDMQAKAQQFADGEITAEEMDEGSFRQVYCTSLNALIHVLLFPTIFDPDNSASMSTQSADSDGAASIPPLVHEQLDIVQVRERIKACLEINSSLVIEMVQLEIDVQNTVLQSGDQLQVAKSIIALMSRHSAVVKDLQMRSQSPPITTEGRFSAADSYQSGGSNSGAYSRSLKDSAASNPVMLRKIMCGIHPSFPATTTFSAGAVRLYLNALIHAREYDTYILNAQWWWVDYNAKYMGRQDAASLTGINALGGYSLSRILHRQTATLVAPRFKKHLDHFIDTVKRDILAPKPEVYRDMLTKIARLLLLCRRPIPKKGEPIYPSVLFDALKVIGAQYMELLATLVRADDPEIRDSVPREIMTLNSQLGDIIDMAKEFWTPALEQELEAVVEEPVRAQTFQEYMGAIRKYRMQLLDYMHPED
ncbi:hypothetical protein EV182_001274 [Spiromyces aspiralis]|uniref:Uncharacterized protein n=1 Tax=Spiromyces aspiralis TaxID=68401 RepID=A0ACC1HU73_9FUNG|nr:hypothetical protein EV182_001274 [Spiromyces aspiralis]